MTQLFLNFSDLPDRIQQKYLPETMQHRVKFDSIEREIARIVVSDFGSQATLSHIAAKIGEFLQVEACVIVGIELDTFIRDMGSWQTAEFMAENSERWLEELSQSLFTNKTKVQLHGDSEARHETISSEKETIPNRKSVEDLVRELLPTKIALTKLTKVRQETNGVILLVKSSDSSWNDSQQQLFDGLTDSVALAIHQLQLQRQAQTKIQFQSVLNRLSQEISQNSAPEVFFNTCLSEIGSVLQVSRGSILQLKYQNPSPTQRSRQKIVRGTVRVSCQWSANSVSHSFQPTSFSLQDSQLCQNALQIAPQYLAVSELAPFPDLPPEQLGNGDNYRSSALLMVPLMSQASGNSRAALVLGFLVLQHDGWRHWSDDELDLINWISIQIATAMIHHQTLNRVQSIVDDRTAQLTHALEFQAKLTEKMRQQIDQLKKLNQLKDDFLSSMSHELKTPLTSMKMAIKMLRQERLPPTMQTKYLDILEQEWNREYNLIKDLLTLQQVESGELTLTPQELNLGELIEPLAGSFMDKWQHDKGLDLKIDLSDRALNLYTDADSLRYIIEELLTNAGKYSDPDTTVALAAEINGKREPQIAIAVSNYGTGISPEELPHVFDKFRRGKGVTDRAVQGTGLGLALVKYLVDHLNGSIDVASEPVAASHLFVTTFKIELPKFQACSMKSHQI